MATSLRFTLALALILTFARLFFSSATTIDALEQSFTPSYSPTPTPTPAPSKEPQDLAFFSHSSLLPPILSHLGFNAFATAAHSTSWTGPSTLFAPSDSSISSCIYCSIPNLLREHSIPGLFTIDYLRKLPFGTKIETLSPGRCITVTFERPKNGNGSASAAKVFVEGMEVTQPDLFNNGLVVVHGLQSFVSPLSPFSCDFDRMTSLSFPFHPDYTATYKMQPPLMRLMLREAMLRLRSNGFSILALAMKVKYAELVGLTNMTVFAIDDVSIFSGSHSYINNVRFHIVPNHFLTSSDLEKLPVETVLPTLQRSQSLVVTTSGGGFSGTPMRINYVRIKVPDVMRNLKIVVHSVFLPFPHIHPSLAENDHILGGGAVSNGAEHVATDRTANGHCDALDGSTRCSEVPMPQDRRTAEIEDHNGL